MIFIAGDAVTITSQRTQKELVKRDIVLVDQSNTDVNLTIWGTKAETFEPADNPVVCIKGAKVSDFSGVSISALSSSVIQVNPNLGSFSRMFGLLFCICFSIILMFVFQINPDISQSHALKGWYESEGANLTTTSLTQARGAGGSGGNMGVGSNLKTVAEVKRENIGFTEDGRPAFYSTTGYIIMFQKDKALYKACNRSPDGKQCNKKVVCAGFFIFINKMIYLISFAPQVQDQNNGYYRCEKCNTEIEGFQWRLILSFSMGDPTDNQWVTCFQEEGEEILGVKSAELGNMFENDEASYNKVFQVEVSVIKKTKTFSNTISLR